ncbi:MAG: aminotransferase class III-fold pyridoxal phosphate-dependent enzyme [Nakamurella sp.]
MSHADFMPIGSEVWPRVITDLPGPRSRELLDRKNAVFEGPLRSGENIPVVISSKSGHFLTDVDGNVFADHVSAWGAAPYGAQPPLVRDAMITAWDRFGMEISQYISTEPTIALAERLVALAPPGITRVAPTVTGTEAVEGAVKLAREATGRPIILGFLGQYHGESTYLTASSSTDLPENTRGSAQFVSGLLLLPYPQSFRAPFHDGPGPYDDTLVLDYLRDWILRYQVEPDQIAGVLIEPVAGEAGILAPSQAFWDRLTAMCHEFGWVLILDEVQTCLGRCGTVFAANLWGVEPDLLLIGKGLAAGGQAMAGILGTERMMADSSVHVGGTYAWEPSACAASIAGLDMLADGTILANARELEKVAREELMPLIDEIPQVGDVRTVGAWVCVEFVAERGTLTPAPELQHAVHLGALRRGVLAISEPSKSVYRMQPALTMEPELFRWSCQQLADAIREAVAEL